MPFRPSSSCRRFRRLHAEFVDELLPFETQRICWRHRDECAACARHDVMVRRALLAVQVLPVIRASADFRWRLFERLRQEQIVSARHTPRYARRGVVAAAAR